MRHGEKMKALDDEIGRLDAEIARLQAKREGIIRAKELVSGVVHVPEPSSPRRRSANIKPLILDLMKDAAEAGATSADVAVRVRERVPTVAKDTVGSVLSRLKADGALVHDGERYYDARFAPKSDKPPFEGMRVVSG